MIAPANTGIDAISKKAVINQVHTKIGIFIRVIPGALILSIVAMTLIAPNIDDNPNQPTKYGVRGIPTMLLFKDGELKATKVGATTKSNIVSWIKENI